MGCSIQILLLSALVVCYTSDLVLGHKDAGGEQSQLTLSSFARVNCTHSVNPANPVHNGHHQRHGRGRRAMKCPPDTLAVYQGRVDPLPGGLPEHLVNICNIATNCTTYRIYLSCGWFASAKLINPRVFRRLRFNNCLVNDGKDLEEGRCLSFTYSETYPYPLAVKSVKCKHPK
ncbi:hypothetical protein MKW98_022503 [Papaver atlanticum]|uniref:Uncharacterized protein n=1 Tax=Papaver atlanticum TaxID=357466 RepID=A0AAD4XS01_9MAGN|nr:hypothetical protein MKW98_022503 [Papaver atlanticum]